jgi:hypothetical protein
MTMDCFADMLKVFEKMKDHDEYKYLRFVFIVKDTLLNERLQFQRG